MHMILAIDLGSTSFKAALFDRRLRQLASGSARLAHRFGRSGCAEIEVARVQAALRGALAAAEVSTHEVSIIALTSQAQTFSLVDARGRALMPFLSWQDTRSTNACAELTRKLADFGEHSSFGEVLSGLQICHLRRLRPGRGTMPLKLPTYIARLWSGESVMDTNLAAMSGLYSLPLRGWWPAALRACGLCERQMPRLIPVGEIATLTTAAATRFGLPAGVPIVLAGNDQTAGGYAARLETSKALLITLGTAQAVYACCARMPRPRAGTIRGPYPDGRFYRMASDSCGGNIVNWAQTIIAGCNDDARFFSAAARAPQGCHGLAFDAAMDIGNGRWQSLALHHTPADLARSVLESLSQRTAGLVRRLGLSLQDRQVLAAGGGSAQPLWRQLVADALGAKLALTEARPLLGAARMAARHLPGVAT
jgi:xylulokinase